MNTITNLNTFPLGNSLDGINIISEEINTLSLLVDGTNSMLADLNMDNHIIKNLDAGVDSLDAVNKSQLDLKADTAYVNSQDSLRVLKSGDTMSGQLTLNYTTPVVNIKATNENQNATLQLSTPFNNGNTLKTAIIASGITSFSRANLNFCLNSTANNTTNVSLSDSKMVILNGGNVGIGITNPTAKLDVNGTSLMRGNMSMAGINKITNLSAGTDNTDAVNKLQMDNSLNDLRTYVDSSLNALKIYTDSSLNLLRTYVDSSLNSLKVYTDSSLNLLRTYVDSQDLDNRTYIDASLNLKVNKAGDTISGNLAILKNVSIGLPSFYAPLTVSGETVILGNLSSKGFNNDGNAFINGNAVINTPSTATTIDKQLSLRVNNNTNNGLFFHNNLSPGSWNGLVDANDKAIIFSDGTAGTGKLVIGNWGEYGMKLDGVNGSMTLNSKQTINKNTSYSNTTSSIIPDLTTGTIYDYYTLTQSGLSSIITIIVPSTTGGTNLLGKSINISFPVTNTVVLTTTIGEIINLNGTSYTTDTPIISSSFCLVCNNSSKGVYTTGPYTTVSNTDQLTLESNVETNANSEFAGLRFAGSGVELGFIRVDTTSRTKSSANMTFYIRRSNTITTPLIINNNIIATVPIIANGVITRNAWSSGELIKTTILNQTTNGANIQQVAAGGTLDWFFPVFGIVNPTITSSRIVMSFDAPYHLTGSGGDTIELSIYDTTGGTANFVYRKSQYYDGAGGGGTRSGPIFPFTFSHTPSQATGTATRTYQMTIVNRSNDVLYLCQGVFNNVIIPLNYYTFEIKEIKI